MSLTDEIDSREIFGATNTNKDSTDLARPGTEVVFHSSNSTTPIESSSGQSGTQQSENNLAEDHISSLTNPLCLSFSENKQAVSEYRVCAPVLI